MNNTITEDYCSFEVSKLLKEKGFNCLVNIKYTICDEDGEDKWSKVGENSLSFLNGIEDWYACPTHALAIKWIRDNFGLFISTQPIWYNKHSKLAHFYLIYKDPENEVGNHEDRFEEILKGSYQEVSGNYLNDEKYDKLIFEKEFAFITVEEAEEAALLYTLKNLI